MDKDKYAILVIDDEESIRRLLQKELANANREVFVAGDGAEAMTMVRNHWFDVIIMDLWLPDISDLDLLIRIRESIPHIEVIVITGHGDVDIAVEAMKLGACDFIRKPFNLDRLDLIVEKAHQRVRLSRENAMLRHSTGQEQQVRFIGNSQAIRDIQFLIDKVAPARIPVLITGESGSGKDVVARLIHNRSPLAANPMIVKNCATLQKELARSELFGHIKGSFTGANESREGLLAFAHDSTLFLDEIGELPVSLQVKLLRLLETGTFRRVGGLESLPADFRLISATHRDLPAMVDAEQFRRDLYFRINTFPIHTPALHERPEDISLLADALRRRVDHRPERTFTAEALAWLRDRRYSGNIRELRNLIERACLMADGEQIALADLQDNEDPPPAPAQGRVGAFTLDAPVDLSVLERRYLDWLLGRLDGDIAAAAAVLGVSPRTLYRKRRLPG